MTFEANLHQAELIIDKNRDGEMWTVVCGFDGNHARFVNEPSPWMPPEHESEPNKTANGRWRT